MDCRGGLTDQLSRPPTRDFGGLLLARIQQS
ncbi:MAG: hypothetical protein QOD36_4420, partial [Mycobacterium sp.]|nr:hypothetical protein [Mycobacterium sp.]